jgi:hypothetical protein
VIILLAVTSSPLTSKEALDGFCWFLCFFLLAADKPTRPLNPNPPQDSHTQYILTRLCIGETNQFASNAWIVTAVREDRVVES